MAESANRKKTGGRRARRSVKKGFTFTETALLCVLAFVVAVIPLVVRAASLTPTSEELLARPNAVIWDCFSYYKSLLINVSFALIILFTAIGAAAGEIKPAAKALLRPENAAACVFLLFTLLSAVLSAYPQTAYNGAAQRYEGVFVLFAYMAFFLTAKTLCADARKARAILCFYLAACFALGVIGVFQAFGRDFFATDAARRLVLGKYYGVYDLTIGFDSVYQTLYNPNCAGLFAAFATPVFLFVCVFSKRPAVKIVCAAYAAMFLICLRGARSTAGFFGLAAGLLLGFAVLSVRVFKFSPAKNVYAKALLCVLAAFAVFTAANIKTAPEIIRRITKMDRGGDEAVICGISIDKGAVALTTRAGARYFLTARGKSFSLADEAGREALPVSGGALFLDGFGAMEQQWHENMCLVSFGAAQFMFEVGENGAVYLLTSKMERYDFREYKKLGPPGFERAFSGRAFIWSRSIPLLGGVKTFLAGVGPDAFTYVFPQNDLQGKVAASGQPYGIIDKPHNTYLLTAVNTGVVSLAALLFIFISFMVISVRRLTAAKDACDFGLRLGLVCGVFAYLVCSLSTDSTVSVSPLFFVCLGMAYALCVNNEEDIRCIE